MPNQRIKLAIIIPAYNEGTMISQVLASLPTKIDGISKIISIVVDDGSDDNTAENAKKHADLVIKHIINLGVGAATITGFEAAKKLGADIIVTMDADGQHSPKDVKKLIKPILDQKVDVVIGTRMLNTNGMPILKIIGNWLMNFVTFLVFHQWSTDSQSGMKAFDRKAIKKMHFHSMGYEICSEILGEIKRNNLKLIEVPIEVKYSDYSKVKGQNWLNGVNIFTRILTIKLASKK
jgi:glycosyltransferase involved in cell wall biosynthesis